MYIDDKKWISDDFEIHFHTILKSAFLSLIKNTIYKKWLGDKWLGDNSYIFWSDFYSWDAIIDIVAQYPEHFKNHPIQYDYICVDFVDGIHKTKDNLMKIFKPNSILDMVLFNPNDINQDQTCFVILNYITPEKFQTNFGIDCHDKRFSYLEIRS